MDDLDSQLAVLRRDPLKHAVILKYLLATPGARLHQIVRGDMSANLLLIDPKLSSYDRRTYPEATAAVLIASDDPDFTRELMPVEGHSADDFIRIVDIAAHEFGTVFVELPTNWTNWSLSLLARSDLVLVVAELSVTSINRARRQIELLRSEGLGDLEYRIVINRFDKGQLRSIRLSDVSDALGYPITQTVTHDPAIMRTASDRGVTIDEVKRKSAVGKDIDSLDAAIAAALGLER